MPQIVTPPEMARQLGVTGLQLRNWLRAQAAAGHPLLAGHVKWQRWEFSPGDAATLMEEFQAGGRRGGTRTAKSAAKQAQPGEQLPERSDDAGHRVTELWMEREIETLEDLLRPGLRAVVVGINPAPVSVAAGHYWQGNTGRTLWKRLAKVGLMTTDWDGFEDDAAFAAGLGFTDVVKRPSRAADLLTAQELEYGRSKLEAKLTDLEVPLVIFVFKKAAEALLGPLEGNGFVHRTLGEAEVFVMPGPYERRESAEATLAELADWVGR